MSEGMIVMHFFVMARQTTLCGKRLIDFGRLDWWVSDKEVASKKVNCPDCLRVRDAAKSMVDASKGAL